MPGRARAARLNAIADRSTKRSEPQKLGLVERRSSCERPSFSRAGCVRSGCRQGAIGDYRVQARAYPMRRARRLCCYFALIAGNSGGISASERRGSLDPRRARAGASARGPRGCRSYPRWRAVVRAICRAISRDIPGSRWRWRAGRRRRMASKRCLLAVVRRVGGGETLVDEIARVSEDLRQTPVEMARSAARA